MNMQLHKNQQIQQHQQQPQFSQQTQHAHQSVPPQLQQQQPIIKLHSMMQQEVAAATQGTTKKKTHQQQYKYHSADMGLDHGEGVPISSVSAGGMAGEALIRLQPISQNKLRGPGSGSDDDLSIVDDINASSNGPEGVASGGQTHKKNVTKVKAGSIIITNQHQNSVKQPQKITASKNKFDIQSLVAQGQDGCPSRKTSSRDKSYPSNNSAAAAMGSGMSMLVGSHTFANSHLNHKLISQTQHDPTSQQKSQSNERTQSKQATGGSALFTSFFSQQQPAVGVDSQTYEFLTKTLGSTVSGHVSNQGQQINPQNSVIKAPSTGKQILKKGVDIEIVRKQQQEQHQMMSSQVNQQQLLNSKNKTDDKTATTPLYNSFQQQHQPLSSFSQQQKVHNQKPGGTATVPGSQTVSQQFIHTLNTFTQNYYGAQHEKMKKRQNQIQSIHQSKLNGGASALGGGQNPYHKRDNSEGVQNSRQQLKFGQIMEELEKFSISNTNQLNFHHNKEEDALTESVAQSSVCESELEFTYVGNIRASTYKRTVENQEQRRRLIKYKSEERKKEPSFFTKEYMDNRYINDRVEVELKDFKSEIEKKYEGSKLRDFKFPRIPIKSASTTRPNRQLKALPQVYGQSRGHSAEEDPIEAILKQQLPQRITLGGKNVIFKTTGSGLSKQPKTGNLAKGQKLNVLEEFPVEITKTHDLRLHGLHILKQEDHASSFNQSITDMMMPQSLTQDSIMFIEQTQKKPSSSANRQHQLHNTQGSSQNNNKAHMNVLLQNFIKQSFDNRDGQPAHQAKPQLNVIGTGSSTKKSSKVMNISKDNMTINTFDASQPSSNLNRVALQKIQPPSTDEAQLKKQQNPKNYSLQLNQVVKKILNDSSGGKEENTAQNVQPGGKSFDAAQMVYEPSFYTTESYKHGGVQQHQFNPNLSQVQQQQHQFTKDNAKLDVVKNEAEEDEEEEDQMLQSCTNVSDHKKRNATSTKKPLKVKRSDSNGSQQKNTLLNKIFRSSKTLKSPQSRQSNMNLNNQNAMNPAAIQKAGPTAQAEMLRFMKPSQTVHQSNINSNMSSVRQLQIIQSKQPVTHSRQGSSGIRATAKSTAQKGSRLPSTSNKKHHQYNLSHVPSTHNQNNLLNFQTDTGASFHNYPQSNSNRGGAHSKDKKGINSLMIKSSQIKRTSAERQNNSQTRADQNLMKTKGSVLSTISAKETSLTHSKVGQTQLLDTSANFVHMQRSFHTNHATISGVPVSGPGLVDQSLLLKKQNNAPTASTVVKGSVTSSPTNQQQKKSHSMTTKNGQRNPSNMSGQPSGGTKLVNLGILNQISNPQTNGRGGKITYRNNYQRGIGSNNNTNIIVPGQHFTVITQSAISMSKKPGSSGERAGITSGGLNIIGTGAAHHDYLASIQQNALKRQ